MSIRPTIALCGVFLALQVASERATPTFADAGPDREARMTTPKTYWISSTNGADANDGSQGRPWQHFARAFDTTATPHMRSCDTLIVRSGLYDDWLDDPDIPAGKSWNPGEYTVIRWDGEGSKPILHPSFYGPEHGGGTFGLRAKYVEVDGLIIEGGGGMGGHQRLKNMEFRNSESTGLFGDGEYSFLINCKFYNNGRNGLDHGIYTKTSHTVFDGCEAYDNAGWGFHFHDATYTHSPHDNVIRNCRAWNNKSIGFGTTGFRNRWINCVAHDNGIGIGWGRENQIYNCTVYRNRTGIDVRNDRGSVVRNNICYMNGDGPADNLVDVGEGTVASGNLTDNTDPGFADLDNLDFHLTWASTVAIDRGSSDAVGIADVDSDGLSRPQGAEYDIGAYEFPVDRSRTYWIDALTGDDTGDGTEEHPWQHFARAFDVTRGPRMQTGNTLIVKSGVYDDWLDDQDIPSGTGWERGEYTIIKWDGKGTKPILRPSSFGPEHPAGPFAARARWLKIEGLIFEGGPGSILGEGYQHFEDVEFRGASGSGIAGGIRECRENAFINCTFSNNREHGFYSHPLQSTVDGCEFSHNGGHGFYLHAPENEPSPHWNSFRNSIAHHNGGAGFCSTGRDNRFFNLIAYDNGEGFRFDVHSAGAEGDVSGEGQVLYNSTACHNRTAGISIAGRRTHVSNNLCYMNGSSAADNIVDNGADTGRSNNSTDNVDPRFADLASRDFHLTPESTGALDQGDRLDPVGSDKDGVPRPQGTAYNIGAYELRRQKE